MFLYIVIRHPNLDVQKQYFASAIPFIDSRFKKMVPNLTMHSA